MSTSELELYDVIKEKLGERESKMLLEFVGTKVSKEVSITSKVLATKEDIANLKTDDIANLKTDDFQC